MITGTLSSSSWLSRTKKSFAYCVIFQVPLAPVLDKLASLESYPYVNMRTSGKSLGNRSRGQKTLSLLDDADAVVGLWIDSGSLLSGSSSISPGEIELDLVSMEKVDIGVDMVRSPRPPSGLVGLVRLVNLFPNKEPLRPPEDDMEVSEGRLSAGSVGAGSSELHVFCAWPPNP